MKKRILAITLAFVLILTSSTYIYAANRSELNDKKNDLVNQQQESKDKIKETEKKKDEVEEEISEKIKNISSLDSSIEETNERIKDLNDEISILEKEIKEKEKNIEKKQKEYEETDKLLQDRLVAMYEAGETSYLDVLFTSDGIMDFISKYYLLTELAKCDTDLMEEIEKEKREIEFEKAKVEKNKQKIEANKKEVQDKQTELKVKKAKRKTEVAALSEEERELQEVIDRERKAMQEVDNEISRLAKEIAELDKQNNVTPSYTGGKLNWPCPKYNRISSPFGPRPSPLAGGSRFHKGIDISSSNGNPIVAAESGVVVKVVNGCTHNYGKRRSCGCGGGYGNYLMISHGNGLSTIYAHCASINVSKGQRVSRGQKIAAVGSTGASTGPHLHFGVALNGKYVNPMNYLK